MGKKHFFIFILLLLLGLGVQAAYDDFEDGTIDKWTIVQTTGGTFAASTSANKFGAYGGRMTTDGAGDSAYIYYTNTEILSETSVNVYAWVRTSDATSETTFMIRDTANNTRRQISILNDQFFYQDNVGIKYFTITPTNNTWYRFRINWDSEANNVDFYIYDADNALLESHIDTTPYNTADPASIRILARDDIGNSHTVDWDNVTYTDTAEPTPNYAPDVNVSKIAGNSVLSVLPYISDNDGNVLINFDVFDPENDRLTIDINYSATASEGTGTVLYKDLNLTFAYCADQTWNDVPSDCNVSWDVSLPADGNYFIIAKVSDGVSTDLNISNNAIAIDNTPPSTNSYYLSTDFNTIETNLLFWIKLADAGVGVKGSWYGVYKDGVLDSNGFADANSDGFATTLVSLGSYQTSYLIWYSATDILDNNSLDINISGLYTCLFIPPPKLPAKRFFSQDDARIKDSNQFVSLSDPRAIQLNDSNQFLSKEDTRAKQLVELSLPSQTAYPIELYLTIAIIIAAISVFLIAYKRRG